MDEATQPEPATCAECGHLHFVGSGYLPCPICPCKGQVDLTRGTEVTINPSTVLAFGLSAGPWIVRACKPSPDMREAKKDRGSRIWVEVSDPSGETWSLPREDMEEAR